MSSDVCIDSVCIISLTSILFFHMKSQGPFSLLSLVECLLVSVAEFQASRAREQGTAASEPASQVCETTFETFIKLGERVLEAQKSWPLQKQVRKPPLISTLVDATH